jgi:hypothetical protein
MLYSFLALKEPEHDQLRLEKLGDKDVIARIYQDIA